MHIKAVQHVGLTVADLEKAVKFWTVCLGFSVVHEGRIEGNFAENVTGITGALLVFKVVRRFDFSLELAQYIEPVGKTDLRSPVDVGTAHIALLVEDLDQVVDSAMAHGWSLCGGIATIPTGRNRGMRVAYIRDDIGNIIEVMQD